MEIDEQAIMRFFRGDCTKAEAKQVARYLKAHPEIMDTLFEEGEWLHTLNGAPRLELPYQEGALLETIQEKLYGKKRGMVKHIRPLIRWSVAACFVLWGILMAVHYMQGVNRHNNAASTAGAGMATANDSIIWQNNTPQKESRYLSDGSLVYLEPGSTLRYKKDFEPDKRGLHLEGMAKFIVAKNKNRPFTVVAGNVSTTAVGTIFTVSNLDQSNHTTVRLFEGKVLVKNIKQPVNNLYLLPGEGCAFDGMVLYRVDSGSHTAGSPGDKLAGMQAHHADGVDRPNGSQVVFRNAKLPAVFNALNKLYGINILYKDIPDSILSKTLYSGSFDKTKMKAENVVRTVSMVNDLNWEQVDSLTYLINSTR